MQPLTIAALDEETNMEIDIGVAGIENEGHLYDPEESEEEIEEVPWESDGGPLSSEDY